MLGSLRVDAQVVASLIEIMCLVKHVAFNVNLGLQTLVSSNSQVAQEFHTNSNATVMQPVILIILVASKVHSDKIVMELSKGVCVKGIDNTLPG